MNKIKILYEYSMAYRTARFSICMQNEVSLEQFFAIKRLFITAGHVQTSQNTTIKHETKPVKVETYSKNTLMTIETENTDSRLISFKDGFNFDENYQEWSTNVSNLL